jgi:hypothetical protein
LELFNLHCCVHEYMNYIKYIESKIPSQRHSFHVHFYDIIKCSPNHARWLPIIQLSNSSLPKVVCNHMLLIVCFSMTILRQGVGGSFKKFYDNMVCMLGQLKRYLDKCIEDFVNYKGTNLVHFLFCVCTMYKVFNVVSPWSSPSSLN